jgi:hypothetical protein
MKKFHEEEKYKRPGRRLRAPYMVVNDRLRAGTFDLGGREKKAAVSKQIFFFPFLLSSTEYPPE